MSQPFSELMQKISLFCEQYLWLNTFPEKSLFLAKIALRFAYRLNLTNQIYDCQRFRMFGNQSYPEYWKNWVDFSF